MRKFQLLLIILLLTMGKTTSFQEQELITVNATDNTFISTWNTTLTSTGSSDSSQIKLPLESNGNYNFLVNWGDGTSDIITAWDQVEVTHTYSSEGIYNLTIDGIFDGWSLGGDRLKILDISQWGDMKLGNSGGYFAFAKNLQISAKDAPDLSETTNMRSMFVYATSFNHEIGHWDVSSVTDMYGMFSVATSFNQPIGEWNVYSVTNMKSMFFYASSFNQDISNWDVSSVTDMHTMFLEASSFNQPIGNWDVSSVTDMEYMFYNATLSTENYDNLLIKWAELPLQSQINFHAGNSAYSNQAAASRQKIIDNFDWIITDGGPAEDLTTIATDTRTDTTPFIEITTSEDAFLSILQFYTLSTLLVITIIRIRIKKKKYSKKVHS